jgi:hypothetical protein
MKILRNLFSSKKFVVLIAAAIAYVASRFSFNLEQSDCLAFVGLAASYILGQGMADNGKEKAKIEAGL